MAILFQALFSLTCGGNISDKGYLSNECYGYTLMVWIPCAWLWLSLIGYIPYLRRQKAYQGKITPANTIKMILTIALAIIYIGKFVEQILNEKHPHLAPKTIMFCTLVLSMTLQCVEWKKGFITSGVNFIFSFLALFTMCIYFFKRKETNSQRLVLDILDLALKFSLLVAFSFADKSSIIDLTAVERSSFLSRITFFWMTRFMIKGCKHKLSEKDVPSLLATEQSKHLHQKFKITQQKLSHKNLKLAEIPSTGDSVSLIKVLISMYWKQMGVTFFLRFCYDILIFSNPVLLKTFMTYLETESKDEKAVGYVYSLLFFSISVLLVLFDQAIFSRGWKTGINVSTTLMTVIYDKVQRIGMQTNENVVLINLLSTNVSMFQEMIPYLFILWSGPFQMLICFVMLYLYIGKTALLCFLIIPIIIIFFIISKKIEKMQNKYTEIRGKRIQLLEEMIEYIKSVKLFAQEDAYLKKLNKIRDQEIDYLKKRVYYESVISTLGEMTPQLITLLIFVTLDLTDNIESITEQHVFLTLLALNILETNMSQYADCIFDVIKAKESYKNIVDFLTIEDSSFKPDEEIAHDDIRGSLDLLGENSPKTTDSIYSVVITNATFKDNCLKNINLNIKSRQLVAVCGKQNSGKSALLYALLGQMKKESGTVCRVGKIAYTPQEPWVINDTIKMNILFGRTFQKRHFQQAMKYCCLDEDISEDTIINAKGSNLSGGQLYRINLARAVYSRPNIFLLDNPLCAVDVSTAIKIYNNLLGENGLLKDITRIIVTPPTAHWLPKADQIIVMASDAIDNSNTIVESGTYNELKSKKGIFAQLLQQCSQNRQMSENLNAKQRVGRLFSVQDMPYILQTTSQVGSKFWKSMSAKFRNKSVARSSKFATSERFNRQISRKLYMNKKSLRITQLKVEDLSTDDSDFKVAQRVFRKYLKSLGILAVLSTILIGMLYEGFKTASNYLFEDWSDQINSNRTGETNYLLYSGSFSLVAGIFLFLFGILSTIFAAKASHRIHHSMAENVFNMPLKFFEGTELGLILMPFTENLTDVDYDLPTAFQMWIKDVLKIMVVIVLLVKETQYFAILILCLIIISLLISICFVRATSLLQNFNFKYQGLLYTHFLETESGAHIISAFNNENIFITKAYEYIDNSQKFYWSVIAAKRWAGFLLQFINCFAILITCIYYVSTKVNNDVGLVMTYLIMTVKCFDWVVRTASDIAIKRVSLHKIQEFRDHIPQITGVSSPNWPTEGKIEFLNYSAAYSNATMTCLNDINLCINPGEKVGIVGKSGSGKSSLLLALTRLITRVNGHINIDSKDIELINPKYLRSRLTVFPQNTNLFSENLRSNLDPKEEFSDEELKRVLTEVHLGNQDLDQNCEKFSAGDKQLVGLAKCILNKTKILILDECTANVCATKDEQIQNIIEQKFSDCTVLNIVHKLEMVLKYDKILVMDKGEVKEYDTPKNLTSRKHSFFMKLKEQQSESK